MIRIVQAGIQSLNDSLDIYLVLEWTQLYVWSITAFVCNYVAERLVRIIMGSSQTLDPRVAVRVPIRTVICLLLPLVSCRVHGGLCVRFFGREEEDKVPCPPKVLIP